MYNQFKTAILLGGLTALIVFFGGGGDDDDGGNIVVVLVMAIIAPMEANPSTAHMFIVNPLSGKRITRLREMR